MPQRFTAALGGSSANIAAGILRLGGAAALVSAVSDDAVGRFTLNELKKYGIDTAHVAVISGEARNSLALVETRSENCQSVIYRNGAADFQVTEEQVRGIDLDALRRADPHRHLPRHAALARRIHAADPARE